MTPATPLTLRFDQLRGRNEAALILYVTAGDPEISQLPDVIDALCEGGADVIEVGIPFSDPIADGPTIQASTFRALRRGVTPTGVFSALQGARPSIPIVLMGYCNPALKLGWPHFASEAVAAGASGVILSDLIADEAAEWRESAKRASLDTIFLAAPTSTDERLAKVCESSSGFVYAVSRTGVTGSENPVPPDAAELVARLKRFTSLPICVGFGVSTPSQVGAIARLADGVIVGSALVERLATDWNDGAGRQAIVDWVRALKDATRR